MSRTPVATVTSRAGHAYQQEIAAGPHKVISDVRVASGGSDQGASPHELFLGALGACTAMTMQMVAQRRKWDLKKVTVSVYEELVDDPANAGQKITRITEEIAVEGNLSQPELTALESAAKKCPLYKLLTGPKEVVATLTQAASPQTAAAQPSSQPGSGTPTP